MASSVHERLLQAVTGNPGTGAVTVGAAIVGYQGFVAGDDTKAFDVVIYSVDSNGNPNGLWEVQAQSTYTSATTSLARSAGNVVDGSSGAGVLVNFASGTQRVANVRSTAGVWIIRQTGGTPGTNEAQISHDGTNLNIVNEAGPQTVQFTNTGVLKAAKLQATSGEIDFQTSGTRFGNPAAGVVTVNSWIQNTGGEAALANPFTNATAVMANTNIQFTVIAGRSYRIEGILQVSNTTAGEGVQIDFNGGSATATTFFAAVTSTGTVVAGTPSSTSLAGVINFTSITGTDYININGYIKVNAGGTLILRAAENTHATGTLTVGAGSWIALADTVNL